MFGASNRPNEIEPTLEEINLKIPRRVSLSNNGQSSLWVTLISLSIGVIWLGGALLYLIHQSRQHDALNHQGLEVLANVTSIRSAKGGPYFYYVFQVAGIDYQNDVQWRGGSERPHVGSHIRVLYLSSNPTVNYPKNWGWWNFDYMFLFYLGTLPVYLGTRVGWNLYRDRRLARLGWVTEGTVSLCVQKKNAGNFMVDYEFRTTNGELIEGSNNNCSDEYKSDSKIKVIYLRQHPNRSSSYPLDSYQMVGDKPGRPIDA